VNYLPRNPTPVCSAAIQTAWADMDAGERTIDPCAVVLYLYYGDNFRIECPTGSGNEMNLFEVAREIATRLMTRIFLRDESRVDGQCMEARRNSRRIPIEGLRAVLRILPRDNGAGLGATTRRGGWPRRDVNRDFRSARCDSASRGRQSRRICDETAGEAGASRSTNLGAMNSSDVRFELCNHAIRNSFDATAFVRVSDSARSCQGAYHRFVEPSDAEEAQRK